MIPMTELGEIISTTVISDASETLVGEGCPRNALGLSCLIPQFECLCSLVTDWDVTRGIDGMETKIVHLRLSLVRGRDVAEAVMDSIDMTGLNADYQASQSEVTASLSMRRPENIGVKASVTGTEA